jgi:hypothetical protein
MRESKLLPRDGSAASLLQLSAFTREWRLGSHQRMEAGPSQEVPPIYTYTYIPYLFNKRELH